MHVYHLHVSRFRDYISFCGAATGPGTNLLLLYLGVTVRLITEPSWFLYSSVPHPEYRDKTQAQYQETLIPHFVFHLSFFFTTLFLLSELALFFIVMKELTVFFPLDPCSVICYLYAHALTCCLVCLC